MLPESGCTGSNITLTDFPAYFSQLKHRLLITFKHVHTTKQFHLISLNNPT